MSILEDNTQHLKIKLQHWSHSQDLSFRRCLLKWYWTTVKGLQAKRRADPLHRGSTVHYALEQFHSIEPADRSYDVLEYFFNEYYEQQRQPIKDLADDPIQAERDFDDWHQNIGLKTLQSIWQKYGQDQNIPKLSFTEFKDEVAIGGTDVPYQFRLDALVLGVARPFIFETKTMGRDNRKDFDFHDLQAPRNIWAINKALKLKPPLRHLVYNFIVFPTKTRDGILDRQIFEPDDKEIIAAVYDLPFVISEATRDDLVIFPTFNASCQWSCDFYELCLERKLGHPIDNIIEERFQFRDEPTGVIVVE